MTAKQNTNIKHLEFKKVPKKYTWKNANLALRLFVFQFRIYM
jgi:hypothetical protein